MSTAAPASPTGLSFLERNEFLVRRLHSLSGLVPVGAFMCVHLTTNASVLNGPETFQNAVYSIHGLGKLLPLVEWAFIFAPLIFHAVVGVWIVKSGLPNTSKYAYGSNIRYTLQRASGMIAMVFILYHVFHMHGWFHFDWWQAWAEPAGGHQFRPYNATSTAGVALQNPLMILFYAVGIISSVFHLANGLWTMGITWGAWTSPGAQKKALYACGVFGVGLLAVGMSALAGMVGYGSGEGLEQARRIEEQMFRSRVEAGLTSPGSHKWIENHPIGGDHTDEPAAEESANEGETNDEVQVIEPIAEDE